MKFLLLVSILFLCSCANFEGPKKFNTLEKINYSTSFNDERHLSEAYIPEGPGPFPAVIVVHGGGWSSRSYEDMRSVSKSLASHGFSVLSINYRLAPEAKHPAPIEDLKEAWKHFLANGEKYKIDRKKLALWGYSSGGHISSYYALTNRDPETKLSAVVAGGTPFDLTWYPFSPYINKYLGKFRDQMLNEYVEASPVSHIHKDAPPFFMYHGLQDKLVEPAQSASMQAKLKMAGVEAHLHLVNFWGHSNTFIFSDESVEKGIRFLKEKMDMP